MSAITIKVNGHTHTLDVDPTTPLLYVLADDLELRSAQLKIVGQHVEQRRRRVNIQGVGMPINLNCNGAHILVRYAQLRPASSPAPNGSVSVPFFEYNISSEYIRYSTCCSSIPVHTKSR